MLLRGPRTRLCLILPGFFRRELFLSLCCLAILLAPRGAAAAQGERSGEPFGELFTPQMVAFERFDAENLLPQSSVYDLRERADGYLWMVTLDGLVRFDGVRQRVFDRGTHPGLETTRLSALWDDPASGSLWLGAEDGRLARLEGDLIETFPHLDAALGAVVGLRVQGQRIFVFHHHGAQEAELGADGVLRRVGGSIAGEGDYPCGAALLGSDGRLWQVGNGGFFATRMPPELTAALGAPQRSQCHEDAGGGIWLRSTGGLLWKAEAGALRLDPRGGQLPPGAVPFAEDAAGNLWLRLTEAPRLGRLDRGGRLRRYGEDAGVDPAGDPIRGYFDREGGFWIGGDTALYRYLGEAIGGLALRHPGGVSAVAAHYEEKGGGAIVATRDRRLWQLAADGELLELTARDAGGRLVLRPDLLVDAGGRPWALPFEAPRQRQAFVEHGGAVYIGTDSSLLRWRGGKLAVFPGGRYRQGKLEIAGGINHILPEGESLWLATSEAVVLFDGERATRVWGPPDGVAAGALSLLRDRRGTLWVGTLGGVLRQAGERFEKVPGLGPEIGQARALYQDEQDRLWVGTYDQGLFRRLPDGRVEHAGPRKGFPGGVFTIEPDRRGFLWTTSNLGLLRTRRDEIDRLLATGAGKVASVLYGRSAGLPASECNGGFQAAGYPCRAGGRGEAYCVHTLGGIAVARLEEVPVVNLPPVPAIEDAEVDGLARPFENGELRLSAADRNVLLRFSGIAFEGADQLGFRYRLRGYDPGWVDTGGRREALFGDLPPGRYRLEVEARSREGVVSSQPARLNVVVAPAWWERHAVRALALLLVAALVGAGVRLRLRLLSRRHARREVELKSAAEELEQRVRERTAELDAEVAERRRAEEEARLASATKSAFLAQMSHELRTPMNAIIGLSEILERSPLTAQQHEWVQTVCASGEALLSIIEDILDFSRIEAGRLEIEERPFSPAEVVAEAVRIVGTLAAAKNLELGWSAAPGVPERAVGDAGRLRQVLLNLLGNAVKFTHEGKIAVALGAREKAEGWLLEIAVTDTGIGIAPEAQAKIFEPFTQADASMSRRFGGSGLGLAICRRVIGALGGRLRLNSRLGMGSTFIIDCPVARLPADEETEERDSSPSRLPAAITTAATVATTAAAAPLPPGWRVLIAEDDQVNQLVALSLLQAVGLEGEVAPSGDAALELLAEQSFEVVLMDLHMPGKSGLETSRLIRATLPPERQPYLIALTAAVTPEDRADCRAAGMDDFLGKPIREQDLRAALQRAAAARD